MATYTELADGSLELNGTNIPQANPLYLQAQKEVEDGVSTITAYEASWHEVNAQRLSELDRIDAASIRALREGDADRIAELEAEAQAIRDTFEGDFPS